jgi:hypothetical protein
LTCFIDARPGDLDGASRINGNARPHRMMTNLISGLFQLQFSE